jgi:hypothetical protein
MGSPTDPVRWWTPPFPLAREFVVPDFAAAIFLGLSQHCATYVMGATTAQTKGGELFIVHSSWPGRGWTIGKKGLKNEKDELRPLPGGTTQESGLCRAI